MASEAVFVGTVNSISPDPLSPMASKTLIIRPTKWWKGQKDTATIRVNAAPERGNCPGYRFEVDHTYVIFATMRDGDYYVGDICTHRVREPRLEVFEEGKELDSLVALLKKLSKS